MQVADEDLRPLSDHEGRNDLPEAALDREHRPQTGWNVIGILGGSPETFIVALDYPAEVLGAFETHLKGEGVDVEELDFVDKKDKAAKQS